MIPGPCGDDGSSVPCSQGFVRTFPFTGVHWEEQGGIWLRLLDWRGQERASNTASVSSLGIHVPPGARDMVTGQVRSFAEVL